MEEAGFVVIKKCVECKYQFTADEVCIGRQLMLTDFCKSCRNKYKKLPNRLPKYLLELNEEVDVYVSVA